MFVALKCVRVCVCVVYRKWTVLYIGESGVYLVGNCLKNSNTR